MCKKQERIEELEREIHNIRMREAELYKTLAEGRNHEDQIKWRPWQIALIPIAISLVSGLIAIAAALTK